MKMQKIHLWVMFTLVLAVSCHTSDDENDYIVKKGKFEASIVETGDLQAVNARMINMPFIDYRFAQVNDFKILSLREHGTPVKKGDTIAVMDNSSVSKALLDNQTRLDVENAALNKMLIQHTTKEQEVKTALAVNQASYNMALLQLEKSKFDTEKKQTIKKLELEKATIALNLSKLKSKTVLSSSLKLINIQKIRIKRFEGERRDINKLMSIFYIKSPGKGMLQLSSRNGPMIKVGDKMRRDQEMAGVPDLSKMKVLATINETDIGKISLNQKVVVRLDAYSQVAFEGTISTIGRICYRKNEEDKNKVFNFEVVLAKSDPLLKPGMTVSCEIFFARLSNATYVNNKCIYVTDSGQYVVLEKGHERQNVTLGPGNSKYVVVYGNVPVGEKLVPFEPNTKKN
jgi:HlyD family secretion protein